MIQPHNRLKSLSLYISALAVADTFPLILGMFMNFSGTKRTILECNKYKSYNNHRGVFAAFTTYLNMEDAIELSDQFTFCQIVTTMILVSTMCSILFILNMTFERFYSIIKPHKAASVNTLKRAKITIVTIVVLSTIFNVPIIFTSGSIGRECFAWETGSLENTAVQLHYYASVAINFALPFVLLLIMNSFIIHTLRTRSMLKNLESKGEGRIGGQSLKLKS